MNKKNRSVLIYSPQLNSLGGIETHLVEVSKLLVNEGGFSVTLLTTSNSLSPQLRNELKSCNVDYQYLNISRGKASRIVKLGWLIWAVIKLKKKNWHYIYTNAQGALARVVWFAGGRKTHIVHHHHTSADTSEAGRWNGYRTVLVQVPELIVCSKETKNNIINEVGVRDVRVMYYLFPQGLKRSVVSECRVIDRKLRFAFIGRLVSTKGIDVIMKLSKDALLSDVEWHLYGEGTDYEERSFEGLNNVFYHGAFAGYEALKRIHGSVDALTLFSTHSEGLPVMLLEGMESGLPWIGSDRGGTKELLLREPDCTLLSREFSYDEARDAVRTLADNILSGATSRTELKARYDEKFSTEVNRAKWLAYFNQD